MSAERVNVVVGAASGMGAAVAELLVDRGPLVVADVDADRLVETAARLGGDVRPVVCDLTDDDHVDALVAAVPALGALVVTAGLSPTMAGGRRVHEVNLRALDRFVQRMEPLAEEGSAAVVFASTAGHMVPPDATVDAILDAPNADSYFDDLASLGLDPDDSAFGYALSKRGVLLLVRRHAPAWAARGARLLSLSPGIIDTGMGRQEAEQQPMMADMVASSPLARMGRPEEVAAVAAFLVSAAASFMTGTDVLVDGGSIGTSGS